MGIAHKRQATSIPNVPTLSGVTGAATLDSSGNIDTSSLLADNTATVSDLGTHITSFVSSTAPSTTATPPPSSSSAGHSSASSNSIPIGSVIGICVGVFAALCAVLLLVLWMGSRQRLEKRAHAKRSAAGARNGQQEEDRRKSGRELWVRMEDNGGEKFAMKRTTQISTVPSSVEGSTPTAVARSITVKSSKSNKTFKSLGYGAGLGLSNTFKTPELPPQLEFTDLDIGSGRGFGHSPPPAPFMREHVPVSWDGETIAEGDSYLSLKHGSAANTVSVMSTPSMVPSFQTPPAVETKLHQWEAAEVVSPDGAEDAYGGVEQEPAQPRHPYAARASDETIRKPTVSSGAQHPNPFLDQNPFDDAASVLAQPVPPSAGSSSSASFYSTHSAYTIRPHEEDAAPPALGSGTLHPGHQREESNVDHAMASLIAALNISPEEARSRLSAAVLPTPRVSAVSAVSGLSGLSTYTSQTASEVDAFALDDERYRRFPLPPTDIEHHSG
ncbi:hypothetical protein DFH11DRAFT_1605999 [Phellopilus nigrolimitatus]|nr:hypothetical protein DFH11DRAFT_1605999 [Phellopilus nigrolimitatus]